MKSIGSFIGIGIVLCGFTSCSGEGEGQDADESREGIKITGEISGAENQKVRMWVFDEESGNRMVDSALIENGTFELWTDTEEMREYMIQFGPNNPSLTNTVNNKIYIFPDETADDIEITGSFPGIGDNYTITGDQNSEDYKEYTAFCKPYYDQIYAFHEQASAATDTVAKNRFYKQMDSLNLICRNYSIEFIEENPASPVSWIMLRDFYPPSGMTNFDSTHLAYFEKVSAAMKEKYPYSAYPSYIDRSIDNTLAQLEELNKAPLTDLAPELAFNDPDGNEIKLSSLRGKVVLIDFWASWCGPCRMENPNVVKTYNKYKDKGFTIYSVSLDSKKDDWVKAIENDNLSYWQK